MKISSELNNDRSLAGINHNYAAQHLRLQFFDVTERQRFASFRSCRHSVSPRHPFDKDAPLAKLWPERGGGETGFLPSIQKPFPLADPPIFPTT